VVSNVATVWHEYDHNGRLVPLPALDDEWLTLAEIHLQDSVHCFHQHRRMRNRHRVTHNDLDAGWNDHTVPEPVAAPDGEREVESSTGSLQDSQLPVEEVIEFDNNWVNFDEDWDDENDNELAPVADDE
jgi:hypothetical protein